MSADAGPGCVRWVYFAGLWPVAGVLIAAVIDAVTGIGAPGSSATGVIIAAGFVAGLLCGPLVCGVCAVPTFPLDSSSARVAWPLAAGIAALVSVPLLRLVRDELVATSVVFVVAFPTMLLGCAAAALHESDMRRPVSLRNPAIGVAAGLAATSMMVGLGGELAAGSDLDIRSGTLGDGTTWVGVDAGFSVAQAVELDGRIFVRLDGPGGDERWLRFDEAWTSLADPPFDTTKPVRWQTSGPALAVAGDSILAIELATGEILRTSDGVTWRPVTDLPGRATTYDAGATAIVAGDLGRLSVLSFDDGAGDSDWIELPIAGNDASVSAETVLFATEAEWYVASLLAPGQMRRVDPPASGCAPYEGSLRRQRLEPSTSSWLHVVSLPCASGDTERFVSVDGVSWRPLDPAHDAVGPFEPSAELDTPDVDIELNGREVVVDRWIRRSDGSQIVFVRDPGPDALGGFCC